MSNLIETLTSAIAMQETALRASIPDSQEVAVALVHAQDRLLGVDATQGPPFDLIHGCRIANPGGPLALSLVLGPADRTSLDGSTKLTRNGVLGTLEQWADEFLVTCANLADAKQVLAHLASGFMRGDVAQDGDHSLKVWIAQKRYPPAWRERIDLARLETHSLHVAGDGLTRTTDWQFGYLPDAVVGNVPARIWSDAVRILRARYASVNAPLLETDICDHLADALILGVDAAASVLSAMTLDETNATWHATVPGIAAAPFIRITPTTLMPSHFGLSTQPLLFLARELRRRDAQSWHNAAHQREAAFRHDLAEVFADKRFAHAPTRIQLKRDGGTLRTDIDAAIFDRKTGTLALFEMKSQDPFSRTQDELDRRRDNVLAANRQLSGILDWTKRHKPDEILDRIDHQTAKRFHVQRVLPFVLARTLVHFNDGPAPDKRAAWGTWPEVVRLHDAGTLAPTTANPLQALFTQLQGWPGDPPIPPETPPRTIHLGNLTLMVTVSRPE